MSKCVYDRMISVGGSCITSTMIRCKYFNDKTEELDSDEEVGIVEGQSEEVNLDDGQPEQTTP